MQEMLEKIADFNSTANQKQLNSFRENFDILKLKLSLISEEFEELGEAIVEEDYVEVVDALCDILYVIGGFAWTYKVAKILPEAFDLVHESNMSKFDTNIDDALISIQAYEKKGIKVYYKEINGLFIIFNHETNKVLKSHKYNPVDLKKLVENR